MKNTYNYMDLSRLFEEGIQRAERFKSIPDNIMRLKPNPSSWSAGEIFEHIVRFNTIYLRAVERTLDASQPVITTHPDFSSRKLIGYFIKKTRPPYKIKIKTIAPMKPGNAGDVEHHEFLESLIDMNKKIISLLNDLSKRKLDLDRVKGKNPVFKFKMTLTEFFLMLDAHQQRHFWQAENTLKNLTGNIF